MNTKHIDKAVIDAREYSGMFNTNAFAILHLSTVLEVPYQAAKELFYHYDVSEEA